MNRIPVNVNMNADTSSSPNRQQQNYSSSSEYRTSSSSASNNKTETSTTKTATGGGSPPDFGGDTRYNMRNINDETERIRERMREFEEHCKRVREQAFANRPPMTSTTTTTTRAGGGSPIFSDFDQRVPSSAFDNGVGGSSRFVGSSMHRSSVEDQPDGTKKYRIEFDIGDFEQNELYIGTNGKTLVVKGDRELKAGSATETKTFNRELTLPDYVDVGRMSAFLINNAPSTAPTSSPTAGGASTSSQFRSSQTQLVSQSAVNNVLVVEAPIIMDKYSYRRSAFDQSNKSQSPIRTTMSSSSSPKVGFSTTSRFNGGLGAPSASSFHESSQQHHNHNQNKSSSSSTTMHHKVVRSTSGSNLTGDDIGVERRSAYQSQSNLMNNQSLSPELIPGYPVYDPVEACVVYKFDLSGFDQSEIHLTITNDRVLEIRACKEMRDDLGKIYREFKREIHLEPEVDDKLIKNVLHDGLLTLKIPKTNRPDGLGSLSNSHNLGAPNGFREVYGDDGRLQKLTADFRGFAPENVRIVLSANNVLKVSAQQSEPSPMHKGGSIQKECTRHYTLPAWVQPDSMKAIMSRDGVLTIDFNSTPTAASAAAAASATSSKPGDRININ